MPVYFMFETVNKLIICKDIIFNNILPVVLCTGEVVGIVSTAVVSADVDVLGTLGAVLVSTGVDVLGTLGAVLVETGVATDVIVDGDVNGVPTEVLAEGVVAVVSVEKILIRDTLIEILPLYL